MTFILHVSKATLAYNVKAKLKQDIEVEQERKTPYVSMAAKFACLDAVASSRPRIGKVSKNVGKNWKTKVQSPSVNSTLALSQAARCDGDLSHDA